MTWDTRHDRTTPISLAWGTARRSRPIVLPKRIWCLRTFAVASAIEHFDTIRKCKDGRLVPISLTVSPIRDPSGTIVGASKIARNISERRRIEGELQELQRRLMGLAVASASILESPDTATVASAAIDI